MSLLVTSSRQIEFNGLSSNGIEKPESYTNIMRSPLIIEAESEIAVVSIKCNRTGEFVVPERGLRFGIYWGTELDSPEFLNTGATSATPVTPGECILSKNRVVYIIIPRGTYSQTEFTTEIQNQINKIARETFSNFNECIVTVNTDSVGSVLGLILEFKQNASATDVSTALGTVHACVTADNQTPPEVIDEAYEDGPYPTSDKFVWDQAGKTLTCGSLGVDGDCVAVFDKALSSASGIIEVDFLASSGDLKIGLVRAIDPYTAVPMSFNQETDEAGFAGNKYEEFYDYLFELDRAGVSIVNRVNVAQAYSSAGDDNDSTFMTVIDSASFTGGAPPANSKFTGVDEADTDRFHQVRFERFGERLKISVTNSKTAVTTVLADDTLSCLKPVNMASDKLYLKVEMTNPTDAVVINKYSCDSVGGYKDPRNYGFDDIVKDANRGAGADQEIIRNVTRALVERSNRKVELDTVGAFANFNYIDPTDFEVAPTYKGLNASGGQDRNWVLLFAPSEYGDKPSYQTYPAGIAEDISTELGFTKKIIRETKDKDEALSTTNDIFFKSSRVGGLNGFQTASMFIRFHAGQQQSYNANTGSISKIVYACPRFDINGSVDGPLYYEPNERVYIDLNNPSALTLTNMAIDIVDVNEQLIPNLDGQTQINFHIRKKSTGTART